jgi:hypothetical protein
MRSLLLLLLLTWCAAPALGEELAASAPDVNERERSQLVVLFDATGGPAWVNKTGWKSDAGICAWFGILCANGSVAGRLTP